MQPLLFKVMRKITFITSLIVSALLLLNIFNFMLTDLSKLTEYDYGYLIGKIIILIIFIVIAFLTRTRKSVSALNS